jgi:hypothetical protein
LLLQLQQLLRQQTAARRPALLLQLLGLQQVCGLLLLLLLGVGLLRVHLLHHLRLLLLPPHLHTH